MGGFQIIFPHALLASYVKYYWTLEEDYLAAAVERVIPYGSMQMCFYKGGVSCGEKRLDAQSLVCGQTTTYTDVVTEGKTRIVAVVFRPHGARVFFRMPMNEFSGLNVASDDMGDRELKELELTIADTENVIECVNLLENFLLSRLQPLPCYNTQRLQAVMEKIREDKGQTALASLAETACLGKKQFNRVFAENVGINPKEFLRMVRFQHLLSVMQSSPSGHFTELAYECGFYDQAHLIHEFKTFSGYTPKEYLSICVPYSDYFEGE